MKAETKTKPPEGYRILRKGSLVKEGDKVLFYDNRWYDAQTNRIVGEVFSAAQNRPFIYARKITN